MLAAAALCVVVAAVVAAGWLGESPGFRGWIDQVRDPTGSRGWEQLGDSIRAIYRDDLDAYLADVDAVDWSSLRLGPATDVWGDDGFAHVVAPLESAPSTVPRFLLERGIVHGVCDENGPVGIAVYEDRRPFAGGRFDLSGETGGQARCNDAFHP